ncbi:MAG: CRISPR-associated protein Cas4 [Nostoc sp.]|uniref:CRISPR-associated protein Cas4 n=1 Tax=Nostoc sp. TaxID=1180 RepID=UPI002FFB7CFF
MNQTEYISIAALNQYAYCPHRCWRMFCAGEFTDNQYTIEGTILHDRVHTTGDVQRGETWQIRAIWLKSEQYKLIGKSDLIEAESDPIYPVEYKRGRKGEWDNDELQVCAQALCLEDSLLRTQREHPDVDLNNNITRLENAIAPIEKTNNIDSLRGCRSANFCELLQANPTARALHPIHPAGILLVQLLETATPNPAAHDS